ncbi:MAG: hypothetical protein Q9174_003516 [Haloplaca sp. 1 TL-2023]
MSHYATVACLTTTDDPKALTAWQSTLPSMALSCPYLRHGLLALSAMHSSRLELAQYHQIMYFAAARTHFGKALNAYIPQVKITSEESCPSLFAFAIIVPILSWSFLQTIDMDLHGNAFLDQFIGVWNFLLGAAAVAHGGRRWIHQSSMSSMVTMRHLDNVISELAPSPRIALQALLDRIEQQGTAINPSDDRIYTLPLDPAVETKIYRNSIEMLSNSFPTAAGEPARLGATIGWPVFIDPDFLRLLKQYDPMALVITAHYGAALHAFSGFWWLKGLGSRLTEAIYQVLGEGYRPALEWSLQQVAQSF